ncbi:basal body-orientation factor 1-like isoform X2 [Narcine bancroftii]|uniref:basal body-orientation factor 1-like isoform X2 n=1 Tax=Narcine bancroftii TaxID=1343680 RepID=UPI00383105D6
MVIQSSATITRKIQIRAILLGRGGMTADACAHAPGDVIGTWRAPFPGEQPRPFGERDRGNLHRSGIGRHSAMPKKGKGKGKKDEKSEPKVSKESDMEKAMANAALWESRLNVIERSRVEYRNTARMLARTNETLINDRLQVERDALQVMSYLKKQDLEKETKISQLQQQMMDQKQQAINENKKMVEMHVQQTEYLQNKMWEKTKAMQLVQGELNKVKEFRKKQVFLENELDDIKDTMNTANKEHKETLRQLENKFFEEKIRLEREAEQRLNQLTEQAHTEAVMNLNKRAQCVFKENIRLREAIKIYKMDEERKRRSYKALEDKNAQLASEKETNEQLVKEKVLDSRQQKEKINELQTKVENLEKALGHMAAEFETAKQKMKQEAEFKMATSQVEISRLGAVIEMKDKEMNRVKKLAKNILDQRTDVEMFFLQSLEEVRQQVAYSRAQYKQAAQNAFQRKMLKAYTGKEDYPKIRTFTKSEHSTNCVYQDMEEADKGKQYHKSLVSSASPESVLTIKEGEQASGQDENLNPTFITQTPIDSVSSNVSTIPDLQLPKEVTLPEIVLS